MFSEKKIKSEDELHQAQNFFLNLTFLLFTTDRKALQKLKKR